MKNTLIQKITKTILGTVIVIFATATLISLFIGLGELVFLTGLDSIMDISCTGFDAKIKAGMALFVLLLGIFGVLLAGYTISDYIFKNHE